MSAKVLTIDIETQRAIAEVWSLYKPWIPIDCVHVPARVLCFAAKWRGKDEIFFEAAWDEDEHFHVIESDYREMMRAAFSLLDEADIVISYNGDRFDKQWREREFSRLGMGKPDPYRSLDLIKTNKQWFKAGQLSLKLDWSARHWLKDKKVPHGGSDLWWDIRHGTDKQKAAAIELMTEYNIKDTGLTEQLFEDWKPWIKVNLAMYEPPSADGNKMRCCKCGSTNVHRRGTKYFATEASLFELWRCKNCNATSKGSKRYQMNTELRPV